MEILPEKLQEIVDEHEKDLKKHFSNQVFTELVIRNRKHLLVMLSKHLNLGEIERECRNFHHQEGPGKPPTHTVDKMVAALLVGWLYGHSLRELEERLNTDLMVRWYVGYGIFDSTPDHATLGRFEFWVLSQHRRVYFDSVLGQIYEQFHEQRKQVQIGDTYAMQANAARQGPVAIWRQLSLRGLEALVREIPDPGGLVSGLNWVGLFGAAREKHYAQMSAEERSERLRNAALAAQDFLHRLQKVLAEQPMEACADLRQALGYLQKSLDDEVVIDGEEVRPRKQKGAYCMGSATDPEATFRNHGERDGEPDITLGYNPQVAATKDGLITETQAHTGAMTDQQTVVDLISAQQEHHHICPPKLTYDTAAGYGKIRHAVEQASNGQTIISAPLPDYAGRSERFGPYDFPLSEDGTTLTCPHGKGTDVSYRAPVGDGRTFRFVAHQCWQGKPPTRLKNADLSLRCPLWEQCRDPRQGQRGMRQVFISDYRTQVEAAQAYNQTEEYKRDHKLRQRIERIVAELVRYNGARRCRRIGLGPADWQAKMAATAYNLKWWMRRVTRAQAQAPP
jgi:IS5 family transposase